MRNIITGIDVGSSAVRIVVCEHERKSDTLSILALVKKRSRGLRHGYIVGSEETARALRDALAEAETLSGARIRRALVAVGGVSLGTFTTTGSVAISRADGEVTELDINRAILASEQPIAEKPNIKIIHTIPLEYKIDGKKILGRPVGIKGGKLEVKTLFVTGATPHLNELVKIAENAGVSVEDVFAAPIAESVVTLSPLQKSVGCVLANIGAETVSVITFEEGIPIALQIFPIGSTDITNDIALGFKIPIEEAEAIKCVGALDTRQSQKKMEEIVEARLSDIFELIESHLKKVGRNGLLPAGIIITGGGAHLKEIESTAKEYLHIPARVGENVIIPDGYRFPEIKNSSVDPMSSRDFMRRRERYDQIKQPEWSVAYGLCMLGLNLEGEEALGVRFIKRTKSSLLSWFNQFLP